MDQASLDHSYGHKACFSKVPELFGPKKASCFEMMIFDHVFDARKTKRTAKFGGLDLRRCEDIKDHKGNAPYSKMAANKLFFCLHVKFSPLRLIFTSKFFCFLKMLTRRRGLINMQTKE